MPHRSTPRWVGAVLLVALSCGVLQSARAEGGITPTPFVQYGIDTYFTYRCQPLGELKQWARTEVSQFKALGANSIGLSFPLFTVSLTSNDVFAWTSCKGSGFRTPPAWVVGVVVQIAHAAGLKVFLRPLIDEKNLAARHTWRGELRPRDVEVWFAKYYETLKPYLEMAQSTEVEYFAIETELDSLADQNQWSQVIALSKNLYSGDLEVSYSWDTYAKKLRWPLTIFGFDAYPRLPRDPVTATPKDLLDGWDWLLWHRHSYDIPDLAAATISEIGIAAQDGAYGWPASGGVPFRGHPFNQQVQVNWFTAACAFMRQQKLQGIYFWGPWLAEDRGSMLTRPDPEQPLNIQPRSKPAIKACFTGS